MTDNKSWLWRKKPSEKSPVFPHKQQDPSSKPNDDEMHILLAEKEELESDVKDLNVKLSLALSECNANDELGKKNANTTQEALAGWEKAEAKALSLKEELNEALGQRAAGEERVSQLEAALKECMQQLRFVKEEKEQRIHDVLAKTAKDYEEKRLLFEENLAESGKKMVKMEAEISELSEVLFLKEGHLKELQRKRSKTDADMKELFVKVDALEKQNASLKYEVRVLEKELDIRNEEREFHRRTTDATHKQHLENVKKIAKLESECQRLRILVRKRLPGPAAVAKMRNEVEFLERGPNEGRRKVATPNRSGSNSRLDYVMADNNSSPETPSRKINHLVEKLCLLEEENNALRESLQKKSNELRISKNMYARASLQLSQTETQLEESSKSQMLVDLTKRRHPISCALSGASMSDIADDDKISCAGSWASALISELEQYKDGKEKIATPRSTKSYGISSDINLMDDFVEMEKLALVSVDNPFDSSPVSQSRISPTMRAATVTGNEIVPMSSCEPDLSISLSKLIQTIEGMNLTPQERDTRSLVFKKLELPTGNAIQWKSAEAVAVFQSFLNFCYDLLDRKVDFARFVQEVASILEWIISHCFSLRDTLGVKDSVKKHLDWDETRSESELEPPRFSLPSTNGYQGAIPLLQIQSDLKEEIRTLKDEVRELVSAKKGVEDKLEAMTDEGKSLRTQLETQKQENEDLNSQLSAARVELDDARQKLSSLDGELGKKIKRCEELEAICLELQIQLDSVTTKDVEVAADAFQDEKQIQTDREIATASEKLAKCQETIFNLGKQLKALAPPQDTALFSQAISSPTKTPPPLAAITMTTPREKSLSQRSSLLDKMLADDDDDESPKTKEIICTSEPLKPPPGFQKGSIAFGSEKMRRSFRESGSGSMAIVPSKKQSSGGLFRKLLWRKKKNHSKKLSLPFAT